MFFMMATFDDYVSDDDDDNDEDNNKVDEDNDKALFINVIVMNINVHSVSKNKP